jgi:hypothetical protein
MFTLEITVNTQTEADVFVRTYNQLIAVRTGLRAVAVQTSPGQYQCWVGA